MDTKYTFWTLCRQYDKLEVPIIQRDYAQGRDTPGVERIRKSFVNDYLLDALLKGTPRELDFVYGSVIADPTDATGKTLFVPLDGQQRLTTLFLLHWFVALKEGRMAEARAALSKFTYETRPSAHDFCRWLIKKEQTEKLSGLKQEILDSEWYDEEWDKDPTIKGMVTMLGTFAENEALVNHADSLFDALTDPANPLIFFYFIPLEHFGLSENLYIRMNARGKELTPFEHFKSEFYNIIAYQTDLLEQVKDKIEYKWVGNLWDYKDKNSFIIDKPFMGYLKFLSEMLYFKDAQFRADHYEEDFLNLKLLGTIYAKEENLKFFIFSLDHIGLLKNYAQDDLLWAANTSIHDIFKGTLNSQTDILRSILLYSTLRYFYLQKPAEHFPDFIRVVRNLLENTADKSIREWPRLLASIDNIITSENIYDLLMQPKAADLLDGFYVPQRREEVLKAKLMQAHVGAKKLFEEAEDHHYLRGNIIGLIASNYVKSAEEIEQFDTSSADTVQFDTNKFAAVYRSYITISQGDFAGVKGDLLASALYTHHGWSRVTCDGDYRKNSSTIALALSHSKSPLKADLEDFLRDRERKFVKKLVKRTLPLEETTDVKEQLYLYYILHRRIMKHDVNSFFKNGFNFGWLPKEKGFGSLFVNGIANDQWDSPANPIFQTYKTQFRYSLGLKTDAALSPEIIKGRKRNPFELLAEWAEQ